MCTVAARSAYADSATTPIQSVWCDVVEKGKGDRQACDKFRMDLGNAGMDHHITPL